MKRYKASTIIVLITGVSILTLFCGSIFACILPDMEKEAGMMARCPSNSDKRGDENKNVCSPTEFAQSQNNIKLPQDMKEIRAVTILGQVQTLHTDHIILTKVYSSLADIDYLSDQGEIYIENRNLRL